MDVILLAAISIEKSLLGEPDSFHGKKAVRCVDVFTFKKSAHFEP